MVGWRERLVGFELALHPLKSICLLFSKATSSKKELKYFPVNCHLQFLCVMCSGSTKTPETWVWGEKKAQKPRWEQQPCTPSEEQQITLYTLMSSRWQKKENTSQKISTHSCNLPQFIRSPLAPSSSIAEVIPFPFFNLHSLHLSTIFLFFLLSLTPLKLSLSLFLFLFLAHYPRCQPAILFILLPSTCMPLHKIAAHIDKKTWQLCA